MSKRLIFFLFLFVSGCSSLLLHPQKKFISDPSRLGLPYEDVYLNTPDNIRLHAWFIPAYCAEVAPCPSKANILYLHGNAENISSHTFGIIWLILHGYNLMALDYRGFGKSEGSISLSGSQTDIKTALDYLLKKYPDQPLYVFGQSIGAALTISTVGQYENQQKLSGIVIDSAFSKARKIAREKIAQVWLLWPFQYPLSFLVPENNPEKYVSSITIPKLFLTTKDDEIVPVHHTLDLYEKALFPKEIEIMEEGGHIRALSNEKAKKTLLDFLERNRPASHAQ